MLDPAGYGQVSITEAISIVNDGVGVAAIQASSITINAAASDVINLRGLTIAGLGSGSIGILFNTGGNLAIENCVIRNFFDKGISISPSTSSSFSVSNTIASNSFLNDGILVRPTGSAVVTGVLSKVITNNNGQGVLVDGSATTGASLNVTIVDSEVSNNAASGVVAFSVSGHAPTAVMVRNVVASGNNTGLDVRQCANRRHGAQCRCQQQRYRTS